MPPFLLRFGGKSGSRHRLLKWRWLPITFGRQQVAWQPLPPRPGLRVWMGMMPGIGRRFGAADRGKSGRKKEAGMFGPGQRRTRALTGGCIFGADETRRHHLRYRFACEVGRAGFGKCGAISWSMRALGRFVCAKKPGMPAPSYRLLAHAERSRLSAPPAGYGNAPARYSARWGALAARVGTGFGSAPYYARLRGYLLKRLGKKDLAGLTAWPASEGKRLPFYSVSINEPIPNGA